MLIQRRHRLGPTFHVFGIWGRAVEGG